MSTPNGGHTVTLGGEEIAIKLPPSPAMRLDIFYAAGTNVDRAACAALGACWHGEGRPPARYTRYQHKPLDYGGAVLDGLLARGLPYREILAAAGEVFALVAGSVRDLVGELTTPDEVEAVEDFTGAPAAPGSG